MGKSGEKPPTGHNNQGNDIWLEWIEKNEERIKNKKSMDESSRTNYLNMYKDLRDYRNSRLASKERYENTRARDRRLLDRNFDEVTQYIKKQGKDDPRFTKEDVKERIAEQRTIYREALDEIDEYEKWLQDKRYRTDARAWEEQHSRPRRTGYFRDEVEPSLYFQGEQETRRDYVERLVENDSMSIITEFFPKKEAAKFFPEIIIEKRPDRISSEYSNQIASKKYFSLIKEIYDQFPRKEHENNSNYKQRIKEAVESGDFQLAVARNVINSEPEVDQEIEERAERIKELEVKVADETIPAKERLRCKKDLREQKLELYEKVIEAIQNYYTEERKKARENYYEDLEVRRTIKNINKERVRRRKGRYQRIGQLAGSVFKRKRREQSDE